MHVWQGGRLFRVIITGTGRKRLHTLKALSQPDEAGRPCLTIMLTRRGLIDAAPSPAAPSARGFFVPNYLPRICQRRVFLLPFRARPCIIRHDLRH